MTPRKHKEAPTENNPKPPTPKYDLDGFFLYEGELKIYRRKDGGDQWWGKVYSKTDKKYVRRSLKVKNRERSIIVGVRNDLGFTFRFPKPTHGKGLLPHVSMEEYGIRDIDFTKKDIFMEKKGTRFLLLFISFYLIGQHFF